MVTIEQIDELRKRLNVTYEEAKGALEKCNGDMLEAIIYLEKNHEEKRDSNNQHTKDEHCEDGFSKALGKFINWCKGVIKKGNTNHIIIQKNDNVILRLPITIVVLALIIAPYLTIPLMLIALFTGHKFSFQGKDVENTKANNAMEKMSQAAENIKSEIAK